MSTYTFAAVAVIKHYFNTVNTCDGYDIFLTMQLLTPVHGSCLCVK